MAKSKFNTSPVGRMMLLILSILFQLTNPTSQERISMPWHTREVFRETSGVRTRSGAGIDVGWPERNIV